MPPETIEMLYLSIGIRHFVVSHSVVVDNERSSVTSLITEFTRYWELIMKRHYLLSVALLAVCTSSVFAQQGRGRFGGDGVGGLLAMEEVRKELNITSEQAEKLRAARGNPEDFQNLTREERRERFEQLVKKTEETIKSVLDEKQQQRLSELRIQREGPTALARPEVAEKVGLDQSQKEQIQKILEESRGGDRFDFQNATQEERTRYFAERRERSEKANASILAVLTSTQKETFEKLQGAKFDFPERGRGQRQQ